jgi:hypothetical protein
VFHPKRLLPIYVRSNVSGFRAFAIKNFRVEDYFERRAREEAPLDIIKSKGCASAHIRKWLIENRVDAL